MSSPKSSRQTINRYTSFASAIHLLTSKCITLLDPNTWDDKNDVHFMLKYKEISGAKSVYALCFSRAFQTYHHWRVFASGPDGVCITFDEVKLRAAFSNDLRVEFEEVEYLAINEARKIRPLPEKKLKFLKNSRYRPEQETRVVFTDKEKDEAFPKYQIPIDSIDRITLSPWLSKPLVDPLKTLIKKIDGCEKLNIRRSTLIDYRDWKDLTGTSS